jgi:uncharacterized protein
MIIGILSDVHDHLDRLVEAQRIFAEHQVEEIIFCGDLVSPYILPYLAKWPWRIHAVFGNNEGDKLGFMRRFKELNITNIEYPDRDYIHDITIANKRIFIFHGHLPEVTTLAIESGKYDVICSGHTHDPHIKTVNKTVWINPGSLTGISANQSDSKPTIAILNLNSMSGEIIELNQ